MGDNTAPKKTHYYQWIAAVVAVIFIAAVVFYALKKQSRQGGVAEDNARTQQAGRTSVGARTPVRHVAIVLEENTGYKDVIGNTKDMPYLNSLADTYAYAKNYFANTHPSIGNYFMLTAGAIITNNNSSTSEVSDDNLARHLAAAGKTWKEYSESLPSVGYTGGDQDPYEEHHNPFSYFSDVRGNSAEAANLVPITQLTTDIANHALPDYSFIVPNNFNNAHDCPPQGACNKLATLDNWLKTNIDPLLKSPDFSSPGGGLVIIVFDEAAKSDKTNGGGQVAWVVAGPDVKRGYVSNTLYQHENTLRFTGEEIGLTDFPGKAATAASMQEFMAGN